MKTEDFEQLLASVREGGAILRGEVKASRTFSYPGDKIPNGNSVEEEFAICVETDDSELIIPNKIYRVQRVDDDFVRLIDESDETTIYPAEYFLTVSFPPEVEQILARVAER